MSAGVQDIRRLLPVLDATFQAEQLKMAKIARRIEGLRQQLHALDRPHLAEFMSPASRAGADLRWETWVQDRKTLINQEIALAARDREVAKDALKATLSKLEAARQLEKRARALAVQVAARRASW